METSPSPRIIIISVIVQLLLSFICSAEEVCREHEFHASCAKDQVILINQAQYGRMYTGRCITDDFGYIGHTCKVTNVKRDLDLLCSGRQECKVTITDGLFADHVPCHQELASFLDVSYTCLEVLRTKDECHNNIPETITGAEGYLSSHIAESTKCGGTDSPWRIQSSTGQRINITLYDFSYDPNMEGDLGSGQCKVYATIKDVRKNNPSTICGGTTSQPRVVSVSTGNEVELRFILPPPERGPLPYYLFHYKAIGCPDKAPDPNLIMERLDSDTLKLTCQSTGHVTRLTCEEDVWVGHTADCPPVKAETKKTVQQPGHAMPHALAIAVIVAIAVCVSAAILCIGILCLRKNPQYARHQHPPDGIPPIHPATMKLVAVHQGPDYKTTQTKLVPVSGDHELNTIHRGQERMRHMYALTAGLHPDKRRENNGGQRENNCDNFGNALRDQEGGSLQPTHGFPPPGGHPNDNRPHHIYETPAELLSGSRVSGESGVLVRSGVGNGICGLCGLSDDVCLHRRFDSRDALIEKIQTGPRATNNYSV